MFPSLPEILIILEKYKYIVIFPITIFEGPIIIIISGFLTYLGFLNIFIIYPLLIVGDLIGDSLYYMLGRYGKKFQWIQKIGNFLSSKENSTETLKIHFKKHLIKTLLIGKISHGVGSAFQISAGIAEVNFWEYIVIELMGTIPKTLILFIVGLYIGGSYLTIDKYLDTMAYVIIGLVVVILIYRILSKYSTNLLIKKK